MSIALVLRAASARALLILATTIVLFGGVAAACTDGRLRYVVSDLDAQRALIAAGVLNDNVGSVACDKLEAALRLYDKVYGAPPGTTLAEQVNAIKPRYNDLVSAFDMKEVGQAGRTMMVPHTLVDLSEQHGDQLFYRSKPSGLTMYTYRFGFKHNKPGALLRKSLKGDDRQNVSEFVLSPREFQFSNKDIRGDETVHRVRRAFASSRSLIGHYVYFHDTPVPQFTAPDYLKPLVAYWTPPRETLDGPDEQERLAKLGAWANERALPKVEAGELLSVARGTPETRSPSAIEALVRRWAWRISINAIARLSASGLEEATRRATTVKVDNCIRVTREQRYRIVFATNRAASGTLGTSLFPDSWFGSSVSDKDALSIGCAWITTPSYDDAIAAAPVEARSAESDKGVKESKSEFSTLQARLLGDVDPTTEQIKLIDAERWRFPDEGRALVYVHGFNTSFKTALYTAAQIAAATGYKGRIYLFSWPSAESVWRYMEDMDGAERSEAHFTKFLRAILSDAEVRRIDFMAHSMGAQILTRSLNALLEEFHSRDGIEIGEVILAAPDISTDVFVAKVREITRLGADVTVYGSASDTALLASAKARDSDRRLGLIAQKKIPELDGVDYIDATPLHNVCSGWGYLDVGHSYLTENPAVLKHTAALLSGREAGADLVTTVPKPKHQILKSEAPTCWWRWGG